MRSILSFLSRLWSGRRQRPLLQEPLATPAADADDQASPSQFVGVVESAPLPSPAAPPRRAEIDPPKAAPEDEFEPEDDIQEDAGDEPDDELTPDPFVATPRPAPAEFSPIDLGQRRAEALVAARIGEHKILLTDPAGPGTLAEALNRLLQEGHVTAEFCDNGEEVAHLIYRQKP